MHSAAGMDLSAALVLAPSAEHLVQIAAGISVAKLRERSFLRDLLRRTHEAAPRRPRQRAADADAPDAEIGGFRHGEAGRADQKIDWLRMHRLYHRGDL